MIYQRQIYKVQLKKQTLEATELGEDQPQIFRGVDKDKNRKGELFGIENLLKFKDGSFMSSLVRSFAFSHFVLYHVILNSTQIIFFLRVKQWKKSDNELEQIDEAAVLAELEKRTEDDLDELAEREDELGQPKTQYNESGNETSENEYDEGIDHGDYFNNQRGRARVAQGDDEFDEEMGGVSQMIAATTAMAVQNIYSSDEDASNDEEASNAKPDLKPDVKGKADTKPSLKSVQEVTSHANELGAASHSATGDEKTGPDNKIAAAAAGNSESDEEKKDSEEKSGQANNLMSPEPTQSMGSLGGLRTQQEPTPKTTAGTQSMESLGGLRTQHEPTPKTSVKKKAAPAPAKYSIMGLSFDKTPKKDQPEKKPSGLYLPKYSQDDK